MHDHSTPQLIQIEGFEFTKPQVQVAPTHKPHDHETHFMVGLDIGSTTVKAVIVEAATDKVLWQDYQRHETKQPEKSLEFLKRMEAEGVSVEVVATLALGTSVAVRSFVWLVPDSLWSVSKKY